MLTRADLEAREAQWLAPYAMASRRTKGRLHPEPEDPVRSVYRRDRDRIIHSTAFRRLEYKTQVFVNHEGDYYRTRLTHSLEVAQIAGSIARGLRLNEDLTETVALAHDLGHPPFGHAGEDALREQMELHGGFDHNLQGLRIVDVLEERYPQFPGLNLTWEVREGINKHRAPFDQPGKQPALIDPEMRALLEVQVVDLSDEIAYDNHDIDDGLTSGLIREEQLQALELWATTRATVERQAPTPSPTIRNYQIIRSLIHAQVTDLIAATETRMTRCNIRTVDDVRHAMEPLVGFSPALAALRQPLKDFLRRELYHHYRVSRMATKAKRFIAQLFAVYLKQPEQLPHAPRARLEREDPHRVICDYIAGMTDRYCLEEYKKLFDPYERV